MMGDFRILPFLLLIFYHAPEVSSVTLRDALREQLSDHGDGPRPTSWKLAWAAFANAPDDAATVPDSSMEMLQDVFRFVPDVHPTVVNQILKGQHLEDSEVIRNLLDTPIQDVIGTLNDAMLDVCMDVDNVTCHDYGARDVTTIATDVTTQHPQYDECVADLIPLVIPPVKWLLGYVKNMLENVRTSPRPENPSFICKIGLSTAQSKIQTFIDQSLPDVTEFPLWGLDLVDATAKPPAAILGGQLQWVGGFEMCNNIKVNYTPENDVPNITRTFNGKYCRIKFGQKDKFNTTTNITSDGFLLSLGYGVCLPDTCTRDGLLEHLTGRGSLIDSVLNQIGFEVRNVFCGNELNFETDERAKLAFGIILVLVVLVACATVYDLIIRPVWIPYITQLDTDMFHNKQTNDNSLYPSLQLDSNGHPITMSNGHVSSDTKGQLPVGRQSSITSTRSLLSKTPGSSHGPDELYEKPGFLDRIEAAFVGFSASVGFRKIFDVTNLGSSHLPSLDGIRFLSVVFAIGGNTCLFGILYTESITVSNLVHKLAELPHQLAFQPVINYSFSTDSFLVVSGTVVSYHWLRRLKKAGGRLTLGQFIHFYLHRYWSLMPMMMLVVMMYTCLYKYLLSGPISPPEITDAENCRTSWWGNLLMLGNLINTDASCLAWTWYVPMMFQLHVITPIILIPLSFKRWAGWITLSAMYVVFLSAVSGVVKNHIYGDSGAWYFDYLQTPWCRAGPYFIGIAVGIILHERYFDKIPKNIITRLTSWFLMAMSVGTILLLAFITYTKYRKDDPIKWTEDQTISYHVFARSAWGLAVAYMIVASETGFGGFIKSMISHSCMTPPSRLAYPVFIIHAIFIFKYAYSQYDTIYINFNNLLYMFFGHLVLIFLLGMLIALIFFTPFQGLEFASFGARSKLDLITAGSCPQEFRDLNMSHDHHHVMQGEDKIQDLASDRDIAMQSFNNLVET